jgi:hypothetical protein
LVGNLTKDGDQDGGVEPVIVVLEPCAIAITAQLPADGASRTPVVRRVHIRDVRGRFAVGRFSTALAGESHWDFITVVSLAIVVSVYSDRDKVIPGIAIPLGSIACDRVPARCPLIPGDLEVESGFGIARARKLDGHRPTWASATAAR